MTKKPKKNLFIKLTATLAMLALLIFAANYAIRLFYPLKYMDIIEKYSGEYNLDSDLICAMILSESRFEPDAVSRSGARGLMQLVQMTADWGAVEIGIDNYSYSQIHDPSINIRIGCWYISRLIQQYDSLETALAAYNAGSGNVSEWLNNKKYSKDGKTLDYIPFPETENYVKCVSNRRKIYSLLIPFYR